ncbi:RNA methyltransferase [Stieleria sp. TO1_6]|uniref:TrmH family RNA methyltransferase n=1 Tax=Stieleria tagensis TaxID=2956795 RepID=UPI00209B094F|nr:RNA methyltransferase [Stieleria tagensis]MCO8120217.1 RNA methyltransferase [Stieleria tagensis]
MNVLEIESVDDPRLADYRNLSARPLGRVTGEPYFVVEGQLIVSRLLSSDYHVRSVVVQQGRDLDVIGTPDDDVPVFHLSRDQIRQLSGFDFHRGFLASATRRDYCDWDRFACDPVSLALLQTTDMQNLGSMLRSAAAFGIKQVLIDDQTVDPYARRTMRVSMGAALGMQFFKMSDPLQTLAMLADRGVTSLAATLAADSIPLDQFQRGCDPVVILMGNEANGLPPKIQRAATRRITIPMHHHEDADRQVDSLNVSVAAAIVMHELCKRSKGPV